MTNRGTCVYLCWKLILLFVPIQHMERGTAIPPLIKAFGHATQQQTLAYLGIQAEEIAQIYELEL
ncbi:hypothetical protein NC981_10295 [Leptolyngbya sp. DQ-M1]